MYFTENLSDIISGDAASEANTVDEIAAQIRNESARLEVSKAVQETDNEALSSLLMLSKSNAEPAPKINDQEIASTQHEYQSRTSSMMATKPSTVPPPMVVKRNIPTTERSIRGESNQPLSKTVRIEDLRRFFHLPIVEVAKQLGTCTTALKKICRKNKISKWPYRQIRSITKSIQSLEMASLNDTLNEDLRIQYREQIVTLQNAIDDLIRDPNKVVTLVNMGLSEDLVKNSDRTTSSLMNTGGNGLNGIGVGGVLNMLPWPKPSADVQQIMLAAAAMTTQSAEAAAASSSAAVNKTARSSQKRKAAGHLASDTLLTDFNYVQPGQSDLEEGRAPSKRAHVSSGEATELTSGNKTNALDSLAAATDGINQLRAASSGGALAGDEAVGGGGAADLHKGGNLSQDINSLDDDGGDSDSVVLMMGGDTTDNLRHKIVDIGLTVVQCDLNVESQKLQFSGPVQLAPLQRKKLRPNVSRKVVPLMEPDIGSNFGIEFIPQFILDILHKSLANKSLAELEARLAASEGSPAADGTESAQAVESASPSNDDVAAALQLPSEEPTSLLSDAADQLPVIASS